jgi:hypothetical protein
MGILAHGCMGEPLDLRPSCTQVPDIDDIDIMTSKTSILPYDGDKMQKMITLLQIAQGKSFCKNGIAVTDL